MPLDISSAAKLEKNKLHATGVWLILLEIRFKTETIYIVRNTEPITWGGREWKEFPFEIGDLNENTKEIPKLEIKIANQSRAGQYYMEQNDGGIGAEVILRVVHSEHLDLTEPELDMYFIIEGSYSDEQWAVFTLGGNTVMTKRYPARRLLKDWCPYEFGDIECGVLLDPVIQSGPTPLRCNRTIHNCRIYGNETRFGGDPSIPVGGTYLSNA